MLTLLHKQAATLGTTPAFTLTEAQLRTAYQDLEERFQILRTVLESTRGVIVHKGIAVDVEQALFIAAQPLKTDPERHRPIPV